MMRFVQLAVACVTLVPIVAGPARAGEITYHVEDIGDFGGFGAPNLGQSYSGTGFVGLYPHSFGHLFGVERSDGSRTVLQVDLSALAGMTINSAWLEFVLLNDVSSGPQDVTVTSFTADGNLAHFWTPPDHLGSAVYSVSVFTVNSLDVTHFVQERVAAGADWLGLHLRGSTEFQWTETSSAQSRDAAQVRLVVDFTDPAEVEIVVNPGADSSVINLRGVLTGKGGQKGKGPAAGGILPVAILSRENFDATEVDPQTVQLGDPELCGSAIPLRAGFDDVNDDGLPDLLLYFSIQELLDQGAIDEETGLLLLIGEMFDGFAIHGADAVLVIPARMP